MLSNCHCYHHSLHANELKYWLNDNDIKLDVFLVLLVLPCFFLLDSCMTLTDTVYFPKVKLLFRIDQDITVVILWEETGLSRENPSVQLADHKSSHMPVLGIRPWTHG